VTGDGAGGGWGGIVGAKTMRIDIVWKDGVGLAWVWVGEVSPESCDGLLWVVVTG
jgi:hypothetical protein